MAKKETLRFAHCHTHNWRFLRAFYRHTLAVAPVYVGVWSVLTVLCAALAVRSALIGSVPFIVVYVLLALMCLLRGFLVGLLRLWQGYRDAVRRLGKEDWESVIRFYDSGIQMEDDGRSSARVEWSDCLRLEDQGAWLRLRFQGGRGELYLRKGDFTQGTAEEFADWLAKEHPEIPQAGKA